MKSRILLLALLTFLAALFAHQNAIAADRSQTSATTPPLLFRTLGVGVDTANLFYVDKDKLRPCSIDSQRRSQYFDYSSPTTPLDFVRSVQGPDGKEQRALIAQTQIDPSLRRALLIFTPTDKSGEKLRIMVLKEDASAIPPGGYQVLNFLTSAAEIAAGINKQIVPPGGTIVITPQPAPQMRVYEFRVFGLNPQSRALVPIYSNVYAPDKDVRSLVLLLPSPSSPNQMDVKILQESVNSIRPDDSGQQPVAR